MLWLWLDKLGTELYTILYLITFNVLLLYNIYGICEQLRKSNYSLIPTETPSHGFPWSHLCKCCFNGARGNFSELFSPKSTDDGDWFTVQCFSSSSCSWSVLKWRFNKRTSAQSKDQWEKWIWTWTSLLQRSTSNNHNILRVLRSIPPIIKILFLLFTLVWSIGWTFNCPFGVIYLTSTPYYGHSSKYSIRQDAIYSDICSMETKLVVPVNEFSANLYFQLLVNRLY